MANKFDFESITMSELISPAKINANFKKIESKSYPMLVLSQSEYDAIADKDDNTLYIVK